MGKRLIAGLIVVGLAAGVWVLWPREGSDATTTTLPVAIATTTSTTNATTTSSSTLDVPVATTTTKPESHVVETVEEAEEILRAIWFDWFEGIYNRDEERIREVVGSQQFLDDAKRAFETMRLTSKPTPSSITFESLEILRSDSQCLVIWSRSDLSTLIGPGTEREGVDVLRGVDNQWRMTSAWAYRDDLWAADCESLVKSVEGESKVKVYTSASIEKISGAPGMFDVAIKQNGNAIEERTGAIVTATGFEPYDATKLEHLGFGKS